MKRNLLILFFVTAFGAANAQSLWTPVPTERLSGSEKTEIAVQPVMSYTYYLNTEAMGQLLQNAPKRENYTQPSEIIIPFPNGEGELENFAVYEASVLHPVLQAKYPNIRSYVGQGIENPSTSIRFSTTLFGLHVMMFSTQGTSYIEPYTKDLQHYIVYKKSDIKSPHHFSCLVNDEPVVNVPTNDKPLSVLASDGTLRTYRLAMACTVEYADFHIDQAGLNVGTIQQQKEAVLAAMNVTMTRVNGIYERDMAITMQLIPENEDIIFINSDNFSNNNSGALLGQVQSVIDNIIGFNNYDIGHVVSTGDGGVASLGSVCSSNKARGVTGRPSPVGDPFDVDYVAHEMGHQFGATHTFNNSFQRQSSTAVEPGSGSTIMAYAGISPPNVQSNSDDYFHTISISQMVNFVDGSGGNCATETDNANTAPFISFLNSYTIPKTTAFLLRGNGFDADAGASLTYCWEQVNANGNSSTVNSSPSPFSATGPNFRSLPPSESPNRYMPDLNDVLAGNLTPTWEVVSSVARTFNFALTIRDNQVPNGGQTVRDDITVSVVNTAGPFIVTSQDTNGIIWAGTEQQTITWNVAGTTANGINTANVTIRLSTDGGQNFDTVLAENTPNDGTEVITVPNIDAANCRIMVSADSNIYYAVNSKAFSIDMTNSAENFGIDSFTLYPNPNNGSFRISFLSDTTDDVAISVHDVRGREVFNTIYKNEGLFNRNINVQDLQSGMYIVTIANGSRKVIKKIIVE